MSKVGRSAMDRSCLARLRIAATGYANPNARAVDLRTTLRVALRAHSPRNNRPERNENSVTHVAGQICYLCCRLLRIHHSPARERTLCADAHVAPWCILERRQCVATDRPRRHLLRINAGEPLAPVRPPGALVLLRALDPLGKRNVADIIVQPVLVFVDRGRIDDS